MANTVSKLFVRTFENRVRHLAQQGDTRLRPWVQENSEKGSSHAWGRMAAQSMTAKTTRNVDTPINDSVWSNRVSVVATYHGGDLSEQEDINQLLIDPNSNIAIALSKAAKRQTDDILIAAATGNALDELGNAVVFPVGQVYGDYTSEMDFETATGVNEMFLANNIEPDEPKVFVIGPKQARKLLHIAEATNRFYVETQQLVKGGFVKEWMGFTWIVSTRLLSPQAGQRTCFSMTRQALGLQVSKDVWARVAERPDKSFAWQIYTALSMGAVRVEDEHIVQFQAKDTFTAPA